MAYGLGSRGLLVPSVLVLLWQAFDFTFNWTWLFLWPSVILTMPLVSDKIPISTILLVYSISIAANILVYTLAGFILWWVRESVRP